MNSCPKVTVVVPTKNCSQSIGKLLSALLIQSYQDFEVVVVDSSIDETFKMASSYGVKVICCRTNGLTTARNMGVKNSSGEIVCFTDGDCIVESTWLGKIVSEFNNNDQIGCVGGSVLIEEKSFLGRYYSEALIPIYPRYSKPTIITKSDIFEQPFGEKRFPAGCNLAFRKDALLNVGGFNEKWASAWDEFEVLNRILEKGYLISINPDITVYHTPRQSIIETSRQAYSYGLGAGLFSKTYQKGRIKKRISPTFRAALRTSLHSAAIFRKNGNSLAFAYPFMDILLGISYYSGFAVAYRKRKLQNVSLQN